MTDKNWDAKCLQNLRQLLEPCCAYTMQRAAWLLPTDDHEEEVVKKEIQGWQGNQPQTNLDQENQFAGLWCAALRRKVWRLLEDPNSSTAAKVPASEMSDPREILK